MSAPQRGVLLRRTLDSRSPSRRFDAHALQKELEELERAVAPTKLVTAVKRSGPIVEVAILAARAERHPKAQRTVPSSGATVTAWRPDPW